MKRTAEEVANQKNQTIEKREARIRELEAENERLRASVKDAWYRFLELQEADVFPTRKDVIDIASAAANRMSRALDDRDSEDGSNSQIGDPERLSKVGSSLIDEEEVVVVEVNNLAYPDGVLIEIAWRYNKYPGLKRQHERFREAISDACFALDHGDLDRAKEHLLYALGERERRPDPKQEVTRLREALRVVRRGLKHIAHRTESTATREDAHQGIIEIADALDGGGGQS